MSGGVAVRLEMSAAEWLLVQRGELLLTGGVLRQVDGAIYRHLQSTVGDPRVVKAGRRAYEAAVRNPTTAAVCLGVVGGLVGAFWATGQCVVERKRAAAVVEVGPGQGVPREALMAYLEAARDGRLTTVDIDQFLAVLDRLAPEGEEAPFEGELVDEDEAGAGAATGDEAGECLPAGALVGDDDRAGSGHGVEAVESGPLMVRLAVYARELAVAVGAEDELVPLATSRECGESDGPAGESVGDVIDLRAYLLAQKRILACSA